LSDLQKNRKIFAVYYKFVLATKKRDVFMQPLFAFWHASKIGGTQGR